jgi:hypothetical protein
MCKKYEFNIQKFKKGQVWFCGEEQAVTDALRAANHKALNGSRPYFIVRVNGSMISCVPLTTNITSSDTRNTDICFYNPLSDVESKMVISQITTKGANEFTKYLYSFTEKDTETIIGLIQRSLFVDDTTVYVKPKESVVESEPVVTTVTEPEKPMVNAKKCIMDLETRLRRGVKRGDPLFRTTQEAALWLDKWGNEKSYAVANYFGISISQVYNWKYRAKQKVKGVE